MSWRFLSISTLQDSVDLGIFAYIMSHIVVLVLGDIGRSPRMQYHAVSFANSPAVKQVSLVGYSGEDPTKDVSSNNKIKITPLKLLSELKFLRVIAILHAFMKGILLVFSIFYTLSTLPRYDLIIIQNPPCLPAVVSAALISIVNGSKIVIDWHNLGFAMFQERLGPKHVLVKVAKYLERIVACSCGSYHICVSQALKEWLSTNFNVQATVLYDRPANMFQKSAVSIQKRHDLFCRLQLTESALYGSNPIPSSSASVCSDEGSTVSTTSNGTGSSTVRSETIQTVMKRIKKMTHYRPRTDSGRAAVLISSTSWTPDEDFNLLLDALVEVEAYLGRTLLDKKGVGFYGRIVMVITGKGPMKAAFEDRVADLTSQGKINTFVRIVTTWLSFADYALLMRCADLGVCLHTSTSGLDLPMKVYDMLGSGVPVCAINFATLPELVQHDVNGLIFQNSGELAAQCIRLLVNPYYKNTDVCDGKVLGFSSLAQMRADAPDLGNWDDNWNAVMRPLLGRYVE